jgi:DnaJ-class molecular chaperone
MKTNYEILGITRSTGQEELKAAWKKLARECHPDRFGGSSEASSKFAELSAAYTVLSDPKARLRYDNELDIATGVCAACSGSGVIWKQKGFTSKTEVKCKACRGTGRNFDNKGD